MFSHFFLEVNFFMFKKIKTDSNVLKICKISVGFYLRRTKIVITKMKII